MVAKTSAFARFIDLPENQSAALAVHDLANHLIAGNGAKAVTPLLLHGPTGTGKTCLVEALCREISRSESHLVVACIDAAELRFEAELAIESLENLAQCDLLIVEDVQFLHPTAIELLVQLLDCRRSRRQPSLLTASSGPRHLGFRGARFPSRLTSRLACGLVVALETWQAASRLKLLTEFAQRQQLVLAPEVLNWLAENLAGGGRQLAGAIQQLETLTKLGNGALKSPAIFEHFRGQVEARRPTVQRIAERVGGYFQIDPAKLQSRRRYRRIVLPRQVGMFLARRLTDLSLQQIGDYFGGHDHTTVLHACRKVEQTMLADAVLSGTVQQLHTELG